MCFWGHVSIGHSAVPTQAPRKPLLSKYWWALAVGWALLGSWLCRVEEVAWGHFSPGCSHTVTLDQVHRALGSLTFWAWWLPRWGRPHGHAAPCG